MILVAPIQAVQGRTLERLFLWCPVEEDVPPKSFNTEAGTAAKSGGPTERRESLVNCFVSAIHITFDAETRRARELPSNVLDELGALNCG